MVKKAIVDILQIHFATFTVFSNFSGISFTVDFTTCHAPDVDDALSFFFFSYHLILENVTSREPWRQKLFGVTIPILNDCDKCVINSISNKCMIVTKQLEPTQLNDSNKDDISFSDSNLDKRGKTSFKQKIFFLYFEYRTGRYMYERICISLFISL